jgi:hypothetical protein
MALCSRDFDNIVELIRVAIPTDDVIEFVNTRPENQLVLDLINLTAIAEVNKKTRKYFNEFCQIVKLKPHLILTPYEYEESSITLLNEAAHYCRWYWLEALLMLNAPVNTLNDSGETALDLTARQDTAYRQFGKHRWLLIEHGASVTIGKLAWLCDFKLPCYEIGCLACGGLEDPLTSHNHWKYPLRRIYYGVMVCYLYDLPAELSRLIVLFLTPQLSN